MTSHYFRFNDIHNVSVQKKKVNIYIYICINTNLFLNCVYSNMDMGIYRNLCIYGFIYLL